MVFACASIAALVSGFFSTPTSAQVDPTNTTSTEQVETSEEVTAEDLGAHEPMILPDSPFYIFKRIVREIHFSLTLDPNKKVELDIKHTNQELIDLKRLIDKKGEMNISQEILETVTTIQERMKRLKEEKLPAEVLEHLLDSEIKRQKVLDHIQGKLKDEQSREQIETMREKLLEHVGKSVSSSEFDADMIKRVLEKQRGGEFKNITNLEVLRRIEEKVPEEAKDAIENAQDQAMKRFVEMFPDAKQDVKRAQDTMKALRTAAEKGDVPTMEKLRKVLQDIEKKQMKDPKKKEFFEELRKTMPQMELRVTSTKQLDDERRIEEQKKNPPKEDVGGANPFADVCGSREECMKWCEEHKDEKRCIEAGEREIKEGPDTRTHNRAEIIKEKIQETLELLRREDKPELQPETVQ